MHGMIEDTSTIETEICGYGELRSEFQCVSRVTAQDTTVANITKTTA
jgi:hypothetical protein